MERRDARKRACPVRGALDGNLLSKGSKALSFDPGAVRCPHCQSDQSVNRGKTARGTPRYLCQNPRCAKGSCRRDSCHRGCLPEGKYLIIDRSRNASGVRAPARSLPICPNTVLRELRKKATALASVHTPVLRTLHPAEVAWDRERAGEAELAYLSTGMPLDGRCKHGHLHFCNTT